MSADERDHHGGLQADLPLLSRRRMLAVIGGVGLAAAVTGCGSTVTRSAGGTTSSTTSAGATSSAAAGECTTIPEETAGPYPGDGSNGPNVLSTSGVMRSDITSSFGSASGKAPGVPLTIKLALVDSSTGCRALSGAAVYVWHCDRAGNYSLYSPGVTGENYLRGVQQTDANGLVSFTSIFPACYSGRWPHIHFEVYSSLAAATGGGQRIATSQLALPKAWCDKVFATSGYQQSVTNLKQVSLGSDNVFGNDGGVHQLGTVTGDLDSGFTVALTVPVNPSNTSSSNNAPPGR